MSTSAKLSNVNVCKANSKQGRMLILRTVAEDISPSLVTETFEPRHAEIISQCNESEYIDKDEFTEQDHLALKTLLSVIQGLLQYKPESRDSPEQAASYINWIDHRREADYTYGSENQYCEPDMEGDQASCSESP